MRDLWRPGVGHIVADGKKIKIAIQSARELDRAMFDLRNIWVRFGTAARLGPRLHHIETELILNPGMLPELLSGKTVREDHDAAINPPYGATVWSAT